MRSATMRLNPAMLIAAATLTAACDEAGKTTSPASLAAGTAGASASLMPAARVADDSTAASDVAVSVISYPDSQVVNTAATALRIEQRGAGRAAWFQARGNAGLFVSNGSGAGNALGAISYGSGESFYAEKTQRGGRAIHASAANNSVAGRFENIGGSGDVLQAVSFGSALSLRADNVGGSGAAASFNILNTSSNPSTVLSATTTGLGRAGFFRINNANSTSQALRTTTNGAGQALWVERTSGGANATALIQNTSAGYHGQVLAVNAAGGTAIRVTATGNAAGVIVNTNGGTGLAVIGGAKNAVVHTSSGARALYSEESTEVWFSDYGFGQLANGRVRIRLDGTFAETVNLAGGYHVFVQSYGDAELIVRNRTPEGFDVVRRSGSEDASFSYRVVARRRGFDHVRLARAPWADGVVPRVH